MSLSPFCSVHRRGRSFVRGLDISALSCWTGQSLKQENPLCVCVGRGCQTGLAVNTCQLLTKDDI